MPVGAVAVFLLVALTMGVLAGVALRIGTQIAFDVHVANTPRTLAGR